MSNLLDIFIMKQRALDVDDQNARTVFWVMFEKLSIILSLVIIFAITLALDLPWWAIGAILGFSLGPIVYGHYYFIYIRPVMKRREV
ncbi:MAG: hypothetical protein VXV95_04915 [Candidatus Thermoplasmatota archaeon]|nr:hypothetical protein [Candidatus Thermoplasmatota archaeon]MEC7229374.1 hypothetical protein [Candidatus Thermoplasmatota archaeon]MEC7255721.1 hypothetical protein [Candidatus Thermoplasmatota archaeon]MEC7589167.1 hypothetical protein [Candidatus Thermoplasmatota archaeon]MEC8257950.1 hypothetical protein [Candidatus Thermoplasmatota archaeon]